MSSYRRVLPVLPTTYTTYAAFYTMMDVTEGSMRLFDSALNEWIMSKHRKNRSRNTTCKLFLDHAAFQYPHLGINGKWRKPTLRRKYKNATKTEIDRWMERAWLSYCHKRGEKSFVAVETMDRRSHDTTKSGPILKRLGGSASATKPDKAKVNIKDELKRPSTKKSNKAAVPDNDSSSIGSELDTPEPEETPNSEEEPERNTCIPQTVSAITVRSPPRNKSQFENMETTMHAICEPRDPKRQKQTKYTAIDPVLERMLDLLWENDMLTPEDLVVYAVKKTTEARASQ